MRRFCQSKKGEAERCRAGCGFQVSGDIDMFVDHIKVQAKAGSGGNGCVSFRREAFVPKGGPDGGDGGRGGSIVLRADVHTDNLTRYFYEPILKAKSGEHGLGKQCSGKSAPDKVFAVPAGTLVFRLPQRAVEEGLEPSVEYGTNSQFIDLERSPQDPLKERVAVSPQDLELLADLREPGQEFVLCRGGKGGLGNVHFKSSRNRVPTQFTYGEEGEEGEFYLELRKIADVGLVGYPNAGKSTLLTRLSAARPKVAAYPFTTLTPHLGVVEGEGFQRFSVADIPGLIEGAHRNVGLGHEFLRHIVRCKLLAFVVDAAGSEGRDPVSDIQNLRRELDLYDPTLSHRPWVILANKVDLAEAGPWLDVLKKRFEKIEVLPLSAAQGVGTDFVKNRLSAWVFGSGE
jgi:GTP-binding protein